MNHIDVKTYKRILISLVGGILLPVIWVSVKFVFDIPDRYLPSPVAVWEALNDLEPSLFYHIAVTASRLAIGSFLGIIAGIAIGILLSCYSAMEQLALPSVQAMRAIPPVATVPFFLLWFGFSEIGKYLIIVCGIGFNLAVATLQAIRSMPERYQILFRSFHILPGSLPLSYSLPVALETLGPTVRFSIATGVGLVVVAELLGSQAGLGYLIQTSKSTFAMHTIFLAMFALGLLASAADWLFRKLWERIVFWQAE
jgi:ABC-type nitrate/sulfonate/bicarbonate transport system permease component